jgi:hypothetical protein
MLYHEGGSNLRDAVKRMINRLMPNTLQMQYNRCGKKSKRSFRAADTMIKCKYYSFF